MRAFSFLACVLVVVGSSWAEPQSVPDTPEARVLNTAPDRARPLERAAANRTVVDVAAISRAADELQSTVEHARECSRALRAAEGGAPPNATAFDGTSCAHTRNLNDDLLDRRREFRFLKKWTGEFRKRCNSDLRSDPQCGGLHLLVDRVNAIKSDLYAVMNAEGLREAFTAELVTGLILQRSDAQITSGVETVQPVYLQVKSRPFGLSFDQDRNVEFQIKGRLGRVPALTLVEAPAGEAPSAPNPPAAGDVLSTEQNAFVIDARLDVLRSFGDSVDLSAGAGVGQLWLSDKSLVRTVDGSDQLLTPLPSPGKNGSFLEAGLNLRYFHNQPRELRSEQPSLEPTFELGLDYRRDSRFKLLSSGAGLGFDSPQQRLVVRVGLGSLPVVNRKKPSGGPLLLSLGVEHEFGLKTNGVPSATRIFVRGDLELVKTLAGMN